MSYSRLLVDVLAQISKDANCLTNILKIRESFWNLSAEDTSFERHHNYVSFLGNSY